MDKVGNLNKRPYNITGSGLVKHKVYLIYFVIYLSSSSVVHNDPNECGENFEKVFIKNLK